MSNTPRRAATVLSIATITAALTGPGQTIGVSVFIDHFVDDLSLTRSQVSGAYLVGTLIGATFLPRVGRFIDGHGVRRAQIYAGAAFALALVNMSMVHGLLWLAIGFTGIRFLGQGSLSLISTVTVSLRFSDKRGLALGVFATVSSGLMVASPVVLALGITAHGWRNTWLIAAVLVAASVVPLAWLGLKDMPDGPNDPAGKVNMSAAPSSALVTRVEFTRAQATRTFSFWSLAAVTSATSMLVTALNFHQIDLLGHAGFTETEAAALFIPQIVGSTIAGLATGWIADRVGTSYLPAAGMVLLIGTHWLAATVSPGPIVFVYAVVLGATGAAVRTTASTVLPASYGTANLGSIQGFLTLLNVGASALGPVALAVAVAGFGSYPPAIMALSSLPAAALLLSIFAGNRQRT